MHAKTSHSVSTASLRVRQRLGLSGIVAVLGLLLATDVVPADGGPEQVVVSESDRQGSAWRPEVLTVDSKVPLANLQSNPAEALQPPILVPLPAPMIGAASGLAVAWLFRRRLIRR